MISMHCSSCMLEQYTTLLVCMFGAVCYQTSALEPIAVITSLIKTSTSFALEGEAPGRKNSPSGSNIVYQGLFSPWGLLTENSSATSLPPEMAAPS